MLTSMEHERFPVFQKIFGTVGNVSEAWAIRTLGYEGRPAPARALCAFLDEVASGVETVAASPAFLQGRPPQAFAGLNQFTAYDSRY